MQILRGLRGESVAKFELKRLWTLADAMVFQLILLPYMAATIPTGIEGEDEQ